MGKSWKLGSIPNKDTYARINFLYQAAHTVLERTPHNTPLVRYFCHSVREIAKKLVLRLDPSIKRNICRQCYLLLIPGVTATVRTRSKPQLCRVVTCIECRTSRRFSCRENYILWCENPQSTIPVSTNTGHKRQKKQVSESETAQMVVESYSNDERLDEREESLTHRDHERMSNAVV